MTRPHEDPSCKCKACEAWRDADCWLGPDCEFCAKEGPPPPGWTHFRFRRVTVSAQGTVEYTVKDQ